MPTAKRHSQIFSRVLVVLRQNWIVGLILNGLVVGLVLSYYWIPATRGIWEGVGALHLRWSYGFSLISTVFAAVLLPMSIQWIAGVLPKGRLVQRMGFLTVFWAIQGMVVDFFYHFQSEVFGDEHDAWTLLKKVVLDQFVVTPLWFVPNYLIAFRWAEVGGGWSKFWPTLDREFWRKIYPSVVLTNWLIWIPTVALVYSLPPVLQFPVSSLVMCFYILIVSVLARTHRGKDAGSRSSGA